MSVADRLARMEIRRALSGPQSQERDTPSTTLVLADNPVIVRLRGLVGQLAQFQMGRDDPKLARMGMLLNIVIEELFEEIRDFDEVTFQKYLLVVARITEWVATGDIEIIPEELRPSLGVIEGEILPVE